MTVIESTVLPELLTVIAGQNDERVLVQSLQLEPIQETADILIDILYLQLVKLTNPRSLGGVRREATAPNLIGACKFLSHTRGRLFIRNEVSRRRIRLVWIEVMQPEKGTSVGIRIDVSQPEISQAGRSRFQQRGIAKEHLHERHPERRYRAPAGKRQILIEAPREVTARTQVSVVENRRGSVSSSFEQLGDRRQRVGYHRAWRFRPMNEW